ncbi:hypothetical protein B0J12DRAFT_138985 [Macrophomina phaseolina]|uniref:Pentatricopeptide repeat protein n=1 Tax=Macrophomina phaseolina TaxID=35725 RepID=A0ABQ8G9R8_9PEZI|nr:hypothetical protein B0J12DRAFT_138985 [Macrophomina phaseolina]
MQKLWSRTLRATKCTCRCHQCLSYSTAVVRRTTTAARRRFPALPSSTILYSAIFACAAVADGHAKQQRRDRWDHAIQEAKGELVPGGADADTRALEGREAEDMPERARRDMEVKDAARDFDDGFPDLDTVNPQDLAVLLQQAASGAENVEAAEKLMRTRLDKARRIRGAEQRQYEATEKELLEWENAQKYTMLQARRPEWPENTGPPFDPNSFPPQSLYASDSRKIEGLKSRWTRRKLQTMNLSMAKLILRMCEHEDLGMYPLMRKWDPTLPECWIPDNVYWVAMKEPERRNKLLDQVNSFLASTKMPAREERVPEYKPIFGKYPFYEQDPEGDFHRKCHSMNKRIFETFDKCFKGEINVPTLVSSVCEELMVSSAPPNITTYNALLLGFTRLRQGTLANFVLDSFHEVNMRPDEITCAAALTHYINTSDSRNFTRFLQLMTGLSTSSYALMLARPSLSLSHPSTLQKLQNRVFRHPRRPDRLVQKTRPTPRVMNAVVAGLLKFHGLERTIDICASMAADGWGFDADGLTRFLHACAERSDWDAGWAVWLQLQRLRRLRPPDRPLGRDAYLHMLGLCWKCDKVGVFEQVLQEAEEVAGYRAGALEKDFEKMRRRGLDVFDAAAERRREWLLRHDMAAKFEAEGKLVARLNGEAEGREAGADAGGSAPKDKSVEELMVEAEANVREELERERRTAAAAVEEGEEVSANGAASTAPVGKWRRRPDDGFGQYDDEIAWHAPPPPPPPPPPSSSSLEALQQSRPTTESASLKIENEDNTVGVTIRRVASAKREKKGGKDDDDDWALD